MRNGAERDEAYGGQMLVARFVGGGGRGCISGLCCLLSEGLRCIRSARREGILRRVSAADTPCEGRCVGGFRVVDVVLYRGVALHFESIPVLFVGA